MARKQCFWNIRRNASVGIARGEIPRNFRAFLDVAADRDRSRRRAAAIGLLKSIIPAVETRDHAGAPLARWRFGIDQRLHLVAPFRAFIAAANAPEVMQRAEDLGEPLQVAIKGRRRILGPGRATDAYRDENEYGENGLGHGCR